MSGSDPANENDMATRTQGTFPLSRRSLLRQLGAAPLLLRPSAFSSLIVPDAPAVPGPDTALPFSGVRYTPQYPVRSPLEDVLRLVKPGLDEFPAERDAAQLERILNRWSAELVAGNPAALAGNCASPFESSPLGSSQQNLLRDSHGIRCSRHRFEPAQPIFPQAFTDALRQWLGAGVQTAEFQLTALSDAGGTPRTLTTSVRYSLTLAHAAGTREQRTGHWEVDWRGQPNDPSTKLASPDIASGGQWRMTRLQASTELRTTVHGSGFVDVTGPALGGNSSYAEQLLKGSDHWRTVLDGASGIDLYGNNGIAAGDYDNDGFDDLYVSQPAGLPNRLYRNRGDGTFEDATERAGVGVLDNTACALFADLRNVGLQDLLIVCGSGPLLFINRGDGTFVRKLDAFHFAQPPQGTFTHAAVADYDRDGRLDIYFCLYSYYLGLDQYHYPTPYFDARNGPPNFLMHNEGDGTFLDRTAAAGLNAENDRYSFSCAWNENPGDTPHEPGPTYPDLYVVNDFGRNNLYRNRGDGTFTAVSAAAHVQDVGAGMSAAWADYGNTGRAGLYAANMWSAAGQRIAQQPAFHPNAPAATRALYQRHAGGNALYRAEPDGTFTNVSEPAGVDMGRWAWGSDFLDFDHDGHADLYVANGYISAPDAAGLDATGPDLGSFFWRQVVGRSPEDDTPSLAYEHGWNALNELIRNDSSWSGHERNVLFTNLGDGTFAELSGPLGLDFLEDGRSFALADLDGDGRLEIILKNRNGPQLRILHNRMEHIGDSIGFRLRGTASNRDGIGTVITVRCGALTQTRSLQAGSGFLSQHSKTLLFGLGSGAEAVSATVRWPSGTVQQLGDLPRNHHIELVEGQSTPKTVPFHATPHIWTSPAPPAGRPPPIPTTFGTWLLDPLAAPGFTLPDLQGTPVALASYRGHPVLLHLCSTQVPGAEAQLRLLDTLPPRTLPVLALNLALNLDDPAQQRTLTRQSRRLPVLLATPEIAGIYNLVFRYLFDRRANLPLPTSFLLDADGMIARVYQGAVRPEDLPALLADLHQLPATPEARTRLALPFPGTLNRNTLYLSTFTRNSFTYGVAMFQHGYLDEAAASFEHVIRTRPDDAEAHYNLGTLNLRRSRFTEARAQLQTTLRLRPNYPEAWNNLGMMAAEQGQTADAVHSFIQSLTLRPRYATALLNLGNLYRHERQFTQANTYLERALALEPDDPEAHYALGMLFAQQEQFPAAAGYLARAIALRPGYPEALNNLGVLFVRQGDYTRAEQQFLTCRRLSPAYEQTYLNLARLYLSQGDRTRARQSVEDLLRLNSKSTAGQQALQALGPG